MCHILYARRKAWGHGGLRAGAFGEALGGAFFGARAQQSLGSRTTEHRILIEKNRSRRKDISHDFFGSSATDAAVSLKDLERF